MQSAHRFYAKNFTLKALVGAAYNLTPKAISGGPAWADAAHFDILAGTPNEVRPNNDEQMAMLRKLLAERFQLSFHREPRQLPVYVLSVAKGGSRLRESAADPDVQPDIVNVLYPGRVELPARNATMRQFASMMQRTVLDRPVLDRTGLTGRYDFDLEYSPEDTHGMALMHATPGGTAVPAAELGVSIVSSIQQLGLKLEAQKPAMDAIVVDHAEKTPTEN